MLLIQFCQDEESHACGFMLIMLNCGDLASYCTQKCTTKCFMYLGGMVAL